MAYYVIIRGSLGIGKSTIAKALAKKLKGKYISIDNVLEKHKLDKINKKSGCISKKNFIKANKIVLPKVKQELAKGKIIVFDGCFYHKSQIKHLIKNLKYKHYAFTLKAPLKICIERDVKRKRAYGKAAACAVYKLVSRFDYGKVINTKNHNINKTSKEIMKNLPK